jgi:competence protein ComEC
VRSFARTLLLVALAACRGRVAGSQAGGRDLVIARVMIDPVTVSDERGEWIEIANVGSVAADLAGWSLRSANDAGFTMRASIVVPPGGVVLLARAPNAVNGTRPALVYSGIALANRADWLALRDPDGKTRDSLAWSAPPRGAALVHHALGPAPAQPAGDTAARRDTSARVDARATYSAPATHRVLVVRVLDVGQGDAILIENGRSTVLVDGGPERRPFARWLEELHVPDTLDAVILTHAHVDHFEGLRELFRSRNGRVIRAFWWNGDSATALRQSHLPDSVAARARRGAMRVHDTDDPCGDGRAVCTIALEGGAVLHIMRPFPDTRLENDRSVALKLVGPDSASFTMWLAGDAQHEAIDWFGGGAGYARDPGMHADVLKADHHGSCDGVDDRYLDLVHPSLVIASLGAMNDYGHMHAQAKAAYARHGIPWYRTDQNGTVTIRSPGTPGGGYTVTVERGTKNASGPSDRKSYQPDCAGM